MEEIWLINFCLSSLNRHRMMGDLWIFNFCVSSNNWCRRLEEVFLGTDGWNYGFFVICRESPMDWRSNICFAKFIVPEFKELVLMDGKIIPGYRWLEEWFHREIESPNCSEEVIFGWLKGWKLDYVQRNPKWNFIRGYFLNMSYACASVGERILGNEHQPRPSCSQKPLWCYLPVVRMARHFYV